MAVHVPDLINKLLACGSEVLEQEPKVNWGGCAVYAAHVSMALQALDIPVWGVVAGRGEDLETARNNKKPVTISQWNDAGVDFCHVLIQFEYLDNIWTHDTLMTTQMICRRITGTLRLLPGYLTVPEIVTISEETSGWNWVFNRAIGIPIIKQNVRKYFSRKSAFNLLSVD